LLFCCYVTPLQDDVAIISNILPLLPQDNVNMASAIPLTIATSTTPGQATGLAFGIMSQPDVPEFFSFTATAAGPASFSVAVVSQYGASARSNLDVQLSVFDESGANIGAVNPSGVATADGLGIANASLVLPAAGTYYVALTGAGAGDPKATGYTSYGRWALHETAAAAAATAAEVERAPSVHKQCEGDCRCLFCGVVPVLPVQHLTATPSRAHPLFEQY
jgi:hypothetical protein